MRNDSGRERKTAKPRDPEITSRIMKAVRGKDSKAELSFRRALFAHGIRYRKHYSRAYGTPDVAIIWARTVVFIDGDFWHGRSWKTRGLPNLESLFPSRTDYWVKKIERNIARDRRVDEALHQEGWKVFRFWESEILGDVNRCIDEVIAYLKTTRSSS